MSVNRYLEEFLKPFEPDCVKWRLQGTNTDKTGGWAVAYLDSRAIAKRLDDVVGQLRWKDEYKPWISSKEGASQICIISIYDEDLQEWISKSDGAGMSDIEPIKGGISDAFKRAAVKWGIGRYLYSMEPVWVTAKPRGKSAVILDSEMPKLRRKYMDFLKNADKNNAPKQPTDQPNITPTSNPADAPKTQQTKNTPMYEIVNVKVNRSTQGVRSMLQIKDLKGKNKVATVYYNGEDGNLKSGAKLGSAVFSSRDTEYGKVHILQDFDMAA